MPKPTAKIYLPTPANLRYLAGRLRAGELVALPTETVYGLAADALNPAACRRIFRAKGRPTADPLIVHVRSVNQAKSIAEMNPAALRLAAAFWPGPLTLVVPKKAVVPGIVTAGRNSVALRQPDHPIARRMLALTPHPFAAPSANPFGYISPTTAEHVQTGLGGRIRHIIDGGACPIGVESTIVDLRDPERPRLLRPGRVSRAQIERALGRKLAAGPAGSDRPTRRGLIAPGRLARHYSPHTPLVLHTRIAESAARRSPANEAWLFLRRPRLAGPHIFHLDKRGRLPEAARRLFAILRQLDAGPWRRIHVELARGAGLAEAINDRLRRAAARPG
jgi:L-threonylcarbamoyladenylate synthase